MSAELHDNGKPIVRSGRKATGLVFETAGLPNGSWTGERDGYHARRRGNLRLSNADHSHLHIHLVVPKRSGIRRRRIQEAVYVFG